MGHVTKSQTVGLLKAAHLWPTVLVVSITFILAFTQFTFFESGEIAVAIFFGQLFVGWTNDLIDFPRDKASLRQEKPLVAGSIKESTIKVSIAIALGCTVITSLTSPLGWHGSAIHFLGLLSATAYNLTLKATVLSVLPYVVSFGALPYAIYSAAEDHPPLWLVLAFVLFASAFHFFNVLKDLQIDREQGVMGLPQVLGRKNSISVGVILATIGVLDIMLALFML